MHVSETFTGVIEAAAPILIKFAVALLFGFKQDTHQVQLPSFRESCLIFTSIFLKNKNGGRQF